MIINALYGKNQQPQLEVVHILYQGTAPGIVQPSVLIDSSMTGGTLSQGPSPIYQGQESDRQNFGQYVSKNINEPASFSGHPVVHETNHLPLLQLDEEDPLNMNKLQTLCNNTGTTGGAGSPQSIYEPEARETINGFSNMEPPTPKVGHFQNTALVQGLQKQTKQSAFENKLPEQDDDLNKSSDSNTGTAILTPPHRQVLDNPAQEDFASIADAMNKNKDLKETLSKPADIDDDQAARIAYSLSRSRELSQSRDCQRSERRCASREHKARISNIIKDQVNTGGSEIELGSEASPGGQLTPTVRQAQKRVTEEILVDSLKMGNKSFLPNFKPPNNNAVKSSLYQHSKQSQSRTISPPVVSNSGKVQRITTATPVQSHMKNVMPVNGDLKTIQVIHSQTQSKKHVDQQSPIDFESEVNRNLQTRSMSSSHAEGFQTMAIKELKLQGGFGDQNEYRVSSARPDSSGLNHTYSASLKQRYKNIIGNESESVTAERPLHLTKKGIMQSAAIQGSQETSPRLVVESRTGIREAPEIDKKPVDTDTICQQSNRDMRGTPQKEHNETTILAHSANSQKANSMNEGEFFRDEDDATDGPMETQMNFNIKVDATNLFEPINQSRSSKFKYQPRSRERGAQRICNKGAPGKSSPGGSSGAPTHRRQNPNQAKYPMRQATIEQLSVHGKKAPPKEVKAAQRKKSTRPAFIPRDIRKWKRILQIGETPWTPTQETSGKTHNIKIGDGKFNTRSTPLRKGSPESILDKKERTLDQVNITGGGGDLTNKDLPKSSAPNSPDRDQKLKVNGTSKKKRKDESHLKKESFLQGTSFEPCQRQNITPVPNSQYEKEKKKREFASATSLVVQMKKLDARALNMDESGSQPSSQLGASPRSPRNIFLGSNNMNESANRSVTVAVQSSQGGEVGMKIVKRKDMKHKRKNSIDVFSTCAQKNFLLPDEGKIKVRELSIQNIENVSGDRGPNSKSIDCSIEESNVLKPIGRPSNDEKMASGKNMVTDLDQDIQKSKNHLKLGKPVVSKHNSKLIVIGDCLQPNIKTGNMGEAPVVKRMILGRPQSQSHFQMNKSSVQSRHKKGSIDKNILNTLGNEVVITLEDQQHNQSSPIDQDTNGNDQQTQYLPKDAGEIGRYYHGDSRLVDDFRFDTLNKSPTVADAKSLQNLKNPHLSNHSPGKFETLREIYNQTVEVNSAQLIHVSETSTQNVEGMATHSQGELKSQDKVMRTTITQKSSMQVTDPTPPNSFPHENVDLSSGGSSSSQLQMEQKMLIDATQPQSKKTKQPIKVQRIKTTTLRDKSDGPLVQDGHTNSALEEGESPGLMLQPRNQDADERSSPNTNFNITTEEVKQDFLAMKNFGRNRGIQEEPSINDAPDLMIRRHSKTKKTVVVSSSPQKKYSMSPQRVFHPLQTIQLQMADDMQVQSIRSRHGSLDSGCSPPDTTGGERQAEIDELKDGEMLDSPIMMSSLKNVTNPPKNSFEKTKRAQRVIFNTADGSKQVIVPRMVHNQKEAQASGISKERRKGGDEILPVALLEVPKYFDKMLRTADEQRNNQNTTGMAIEGQRIFTMRQKQIILEEQLRMEEEYRKRREAQKQRALEQIEKMAQQQNHETPHTFSKGQLSSDVYSTQTMNFKYAMQSYGDGANGSRMFLISKGQFLDQPPAMRPITGEDRNRIQGQSEQSVGETETSQQSVAQGVEMGTDNPGWLSPEDEMPMGTNNQQELETDRLESNYARSGRDMNVPQHSGTREMNQPQGPIREVIMQQHYVNESGSQLSSQTAVFQNVDKEMNNDQNKDAETVYIDGHSAVPSNMKKQSQISHNEQLPQYRVASGQQAFSNSFKGSPKTSKTNHMIVSDFQQQHPIAPPLDLDQLGKAVTQQDDRQMRSKRESCQVLSSSKRGTLDSQQERHPSGPIDRSHVRKKVPLTLNGNQSIVKNQPLFTAVLCEPETTTGNILLQQQKLTEAGGLIMVDVDHMETPERNSPSSHDRQHRRQKVEQDRQKVNSINTSMLSEAPSTTQPKEATVMYNYNNFEQNSTGSLEKIQSPVANITINKGIRFKRQQAHMPELKMDPPLWDLASPHVQFAQTTFAQHNARRQRPHTQENARGRIKRTPNFQDSVLSSKKITAPVQNERQTPDKKKQGKTLFQKVSQQMSDAFASHDIQKSHHKQSAGMQFPMNTMSSQIMANRKNFKERDGPQSAFGRHQVLQHTAILASKAQHFVPRRTIFSNTSMHFSRQQVGASNDNKDLQDVVQSDYTSDQDMQPVQALTLNSEQKFMMSESHSDQQSPSGRSFNPGRDHPDLYITVDDGFKPNLQTLVANTTQGDLGDSLERIRPANTGSHFYQNKPMSAGINTRVHKRQRTIRELLDGQTGKPTGAGGGLDFVDAGRLRTQWITGADNTTNQSTEHFHANTTYSPSNNAISKINILNAQNSILPHALKAKLDNIVRSSSFASTSRHPESILLMHQKRDMMARADRLNLCNTAGGRIGANRPQDQKFNTLGSVFLSTDKEEKSTLTRQMTVEKYQGTLSPPCSQAFNTKSQPPRAWVLSKQGQGKTTKKGQLRKIAGGRLMPTGKPKQAPLISC